MLQSPLERDLALYDGGYKFEKYDLVVLAINDLEHTISTIVEMHFATADPYHKYHRVWRIGRQMAEAEVRERLSTLPAIFTGRFAFGLEHLERVRQEEWFEFKALEYRGREYRD